MVVDVLLRIWLIAIPHILQTQGSISTPARASGVVGLKPTSSLTSRHGVFIANAWQDSVGVLSQSVMDAARVLTVIAGECRTRLPHN